MEEIEKEYKSLFLALHPKLVDFAGYYIGYKPEAEEIVNDVFIDVWQHNRTAYSLSSSSYFYTAVKNRCLNYLKKKKLETVPLEKALYQVQSTSNNSDMSALEHQVKKAIDELPPRCRQIFLLRRHGELPTSEVAQLLDLSVKTVENQMTKALKELSKKLK